MGPESGQINPGHLHPTTQSQGIEQECTRPDKINGLLNILSELNQIQDQASDLHRLLGAISKPSDVKSSPEMDRPLENLTQVIEHLPHICQARVCSIRTMLSEIRDSLI